MRIPEVRRGRKPCVRNCSMTESAIRTPDDQKYNCRLWVADRDHQTGIREEFKAAHTDKDTFRKEEESGEKECDSEEDAKSGDLDCPTK